MSVRVSIVIPTFNRARLLPRAIDSSLAQTEPSEVIVCDHGSSDDTPAVAAAYGARIRYVRREQDQGPIVCWRDGVAPRRKPVLRSCDVAPALADAMQTTAPIESATAA